MNFTILLLFTVVDSSGKLPSGIFLGNVNWIGTYEECLEVSSEPLQAQQPDNTTVLGKYCLVKIGDGPPAPGGLMVVGSVLKLMTSFVSCLLSSSAVAYKLLHSIYAERSSCCYGVLRLSGGVLCLLSGMSPVRIPL